MSTKLENTKSNSVLVCEVFGGNINGGTIQGEGIFVGEPSMFLRFFGCNFTCSGFSNDELNEIPKYEGLERIEAVNQLDGNAFVQGCDSRYSWHKDFRHLATKYKVTDLYKELLDNRGNVKHLVITGGEPLMHQSALAELFELIYQDLVNDVPTFEFITIESNCSLALKEELNEVLGKTTSQIKYLFSFSPKLSVSGEPFKKRFNSDILSQLAFINVCRNKGDSIVQVSFKYVAKERKDFEEIKEFHYKLLASSSVLYVYTIGEIEPMVMPMGATLEQYKENEMNVVKLCIEYGWRFTPRLHLYLFGNKVGT